MRYKLLNILAIISLIPQIVFAAGLGTIPASQSFGEYYHLEDVNGTKGQTFTNVGSVTFTQGKFANGANFSSANTTEALEVDNNLGIDGGNITMSVWIQFTGNPADGGAAAYVASQCSNPTRSAYTIEYTLLSGVFTLDFVRSDVGISADRQSNTVASLVDGKWHNLLMTYDGTNINGYIDGQFKGIKASTGTGNNALTVSRFGLGRFKCVDAFVGGYTSGIEDEVIVDSTVWSYQRIQKYYTQSKGRYAPKISF